MGISCVAYAVSDGNIRRVLADPPLVWRLVEPEDDALYLAEIGFDSCAHAPSVPSLVYTGHERYLLDLDRLWDGLGACLKTCAPRMPCFFDDAQPLGHIDVGYGPALYHRSAAMARIAEACAGISEDQLVAAMKTADFDGVYLGDMWETGSAELATCLKDCFADFQAFAAFAARHQLGAVIHMT
ncbi:hypothetical protein GCM10027277_10140 [Pseudoduganella ginsengisoli]|uniref:DUF1877 family protein n=1 Tax=Pseudoduganella ginsengisoli TaxID=1462440 RepID=A0A6L6PV92_9BURK|nr:DUF1877 family protein [Pseudoduganella ginsengisoli]MTW01410.1 DUF1877 family protein [Pseudoduganella ginsengisoli]